MAGFLIQPPVNPRTIVDFHVGEDNLNRRLTSVSSSRVMILHLDGDELEAALWGLEQWNKPGPQVPPETELTDDRVLISVVTNAIAYYMYADHNHDITIHEDSGQPMIHLAHDEIKKAAHMAVKVLEHISTYKKEL